MQICHLPASASQELGLEGNATPGLAKHTFEVTTVRTIMKTFFKGVSEKEMNEGHKNALTI